MSLSGLRSEETGSLHFLSPPTLAIGCQPPGDEKPEPQGEATYRYSGGEHQLSGHLTINIQTSYGRAPSWMSCAAEPLKDSSSSCADRGCVKDPAWELPSWARSTPRTTAGNRELTVKPLSVGVLCYSQMGTRASLHILHPRMTILKKVLEVITSFNKYLLNIFCEPRDIPGTQDSAMNRISKVPAVREQRGREIPGNDRCHVRIQMETWM